MIYVGFGKASNATCYNALNPRNAVTPQPTIFCNILALPCHYECDRNYKAIAPTLQAIAYCEMKSTKHSSLSIEKL
ncbi:hypothetical protein [Nostoc sp.]|uniref:hypothetical protein n=1 Tax=Nostoc sp. TaxID=1180 RepID=UPI002FF9E69A